jgi:alkyl hydroperoxide reductase subunit AhpC
VGLSIDSIFAHIAWLRTIKEKIEYMGMKGVEVNFPLIADIKMEVAKLYGMLQPGASSTKYYARGVGMVLQRTVAGGSEEMVLVKVVRP